MPLKAFLVFLVLNLHSIKYYICKYEIQTSFKLFLISFFTLENKKVEENQKTLLFSPLASSRRNVFEFKNIPEASIFYFSIYLERDEVMPPESNIILVWNYFSLGGPSVIIQYRRLKIYFRAASIYQVVMFSRLFIEARHIFTCRP